MSPVGFKPKALMFEQPKTSHILDCRAAVPASAMHNPAFFDSLCNQQELIKIY